MFRKKKVLAPTPQQALNQLNDTEELLHKKQSYLEHKIQQELDTAKRHGIKNKQSALRALKRKRQYEGQLVKLDGVISTLEFQREALENAATNAEVLQVMATASKAIKAANKVTNVDEVHSMMDDIAEQQQVAEEISNAISNPSSSLMVNEYDESELLAELEQMEREDQAEPTLAAVSGRLSKVAIGQQPQPPLAIPVNEQRHSPNSTPRLVTATKVPAKDAHRPSEKSSSRSRIVTAL